MDVLGVVVEGTIALGIDARGMIELGTIVPAIVALAIVGSMTIVWSTNARPMVAVPSISSSPDDPGAKVYASARGRCLPPNFFT